MPTSYRVEVSPNNRAGCKNKECKDQGIKLTKGELRFGTWVSIPDGKGGDHSSWHWRHWGCVTPSVLANLKQTSEDDLDLVDGYDELPQPLQQKVERALEHGHVDDEDWKGDVDANRPGHKGMRLKRPKDGSVTEDVKEPTSDRPKSEPRKRGRPKKAVSNEAEDSIPKRAKKSSDKYSPRLNEDGAVVGDLKQRGTASDRNNSEDSRVSKLNDSKRKKDKIKTGASKPANIDRGIGEQKSVKASNISKRNPKLRKGAGQGQAE